MSQLFAYVKTIRCSYYIIMYIYIFHVLGPLALFTVLVFGETRKKKTCWRTTTEYFECYDTTTVMSYFIIHLHFYVLGTRKPKQTWIRKKHSRDKWKTTYYLVTRARARSVCGGGIDVYKTCGTYLTREVNKITITDVR